MRKITLLYGTGNPSKLDTMRRSLDGLGIEVLGLRDMEKSAPEVDESGKSPLENAQIKALAYYRFYGIPVFSLDSGLFFENVPDELQPGVHVRNVQGKHLSDDEMIEYYSSLARRFGGRLTARYKNALCLVMSEDEAYLSMDESLWGKAFLLSDTPHKRPHKEGFPLDRLSVEINSGKYYFDLPVSVETEMNKGFRSFFENIFKGETIMSEAFKEMYDVIVDRRANPQEGSYTCYLFDKGLDKILKKCGEECTEMVIAAKNKDNDELANEINDLFYHVAVLMAERGLTVEEVEDIMRERSKKIGNLKQFHTSDHNS